VPTVLQPGKNCDLEKRWLAREGSLHAGYHYSPIIHYLDWDSARSLHP
jgi:hypothetical protein